MAWNELDLESGEWLIPASRTKNKKEHMVPLTDRVIDELKTLKAHYKNLGIKHGNFVFTVAGNRPYAGQRRLKENLDRDSFVEGWVFHDFRRTFSTALSKFGISPRDRRACLNHSIKDGLDKVYDLYDLQKEKKAALTAWTRYLMRTVGEIEPDNVVPMTMDR